MLTMNRVGAAGMAKACGRGNRAGMTLIEVVAAIGIFTVALLLAMSGMMSAIRANRMIAMDIAANAAIRAQSEEMLAVAADNAFTNNDTRFDDQASAILWYYGSKFATIGSTAPADNLPIGVNGAPLPKVEFNDGDPALICRFMIPAPGENTRYVVSEGTASKGDIKPDRRAIGTVTIWLDETAVPPIENAAVMWNDLGLNTGKRTDGFDMNRDDKIASPSNTIRASDFANPESLDIKQLPMDITVTYFNNEAHTTQLYTTTRRIIVTGNY